MLKIVLSPTYFAPVTLHLLAEDGSPQKFEFHGLFKRLSTQEHEELMGRAKKLNLSDTAVARELLIGWRDGDVLGADGQALRFSTESLNALLQINGSGTAICKTYVDSVERVAQGN